ncbi:hypothetical protein HBI23_030210 [Parastagonospora nodorum]|nr:hypothetical protein HBI09_008970 [Parastagonospora nodorum]KAH5026844.1 hypothetical protein HBI77_008960 [Parastagonospora nodorum]KAH5430372.1 hypothetical protein HBI46_008920 [Parastagonospora nodorum]KAH5688818.1 hypothetical protein HBI23_030210 [Parastagonospora nodorum]KAH5774384.1 hypothetical protein HBI17_003420 [Parastagonospora nodorum]
MRWRTFALLFQSLGEGKCHFGIYGHDPADYASNCHSTRETARQSNLTSAKRTPSRDNGNHPLYPVRDEFYQSPPKTVEVLKASSCPETNDRPSFLTTLPAELRNNVYKWLFARDDPIIYTGPGRRDREPDFFPKFNDNYDEMPSFIPEEEIVMRKPSHDLGPNVAMLCTCRQIFHEAVGVLYSGN